MNSWSGFTFIVDFCNEIDALNNVLNAEQKADDESIAKRIKTFEQLLRQLANSTDGSYLIAIDILQATHNALLKVALDFIAISKGSQ